MVIETENAPDPAGPYGQALKECQSLFVSGQVAMNPKKTD